MARWSGKDWYIAAMTDWTARTIEVDLSFFLKGISAATIVKDGVNADSTEATIGLSTESVDEKKKQKISMAPGGGYVAKLQPQ